MFRNTPAGKSKENLSKDQYLAKTQYTIDIRLVKLLNGLTKGFDGVAKCKGGRYALSRSKIFESR